MFIYLFISRIPTTKEILPFAVAETGASRASTPKINIISVMTIHAQNAPLKSDLQAIADSFVVSSDFDDSDADLIYEPDWGI